MSSLKPSAAECVLNLLLHVQNVAARIVKDTLFMAEQDGMSATIVSSNGKLVFIPEKQLGPTEFKKSIYSAKKKEERRLS